MQALLYKVINKSSYNVENKSRVYLLSRCMLNSSFNHYLCHPLRRNSILKEQTILPTYDCICNIHANFEWCRFFRNEMKISNCFLVPDEMFFSVVYGPGSCLSRSCSCASGSHHGTLKHIK